MSADENETLNQVCEEAYKEKSAASYTWGQIRENIIWDNIITLVFLNSGLFGSLIMYSLGLHSVPLKSWTIAWIFILGPVTFFGTSAGAHRLWAHRAYKANLPFRILLVILYSSLGMIKYSMFDWVRDHRVHHKFVETDADPHNAKRGFLFSHCGWLCLKRHPECARRLKEIDLTDIRADAVLMFQKKYTTLCTVLFCFTLPTVVPVIFWGETILNAILTQCFIRYMAVMHCLWSVNSVAHLWGDRPYNRLINPTDNIFVSFFTYGEGSHNYHHTFPWDYKTSELPYLNFNLTTLWIDLFAKFGWAYDLRQPSPQLIEKVVKRIGYKSGITIQHPKFPSDLMSNLIPPLNNESLLRLRKRCSGYLFGVFQSMEDFHSA